MGDLIYLPRRTSHRSRSWADSRPAFFYEVGCVFSYLAGERVERLLGDVQWVPVAAAGLVRGEPPPHGSAVRGCAERRARELRLPLVWSDRFPAGAPGALRAAVYAAELGRDARFGLAANRLAFCGGFDLEDPEILVEAAAAAGVPLEGCIAAASDPARERPLQSTALELLGHGVRRLPAISVGGVWFEGERGLAGAAALYAEADYFRPLAPAG